MTKMRFKAIKSKGSVFLYNKPKEITFTELKKKFLPPSSKLFSGKLTENYCNTTDTCPMQNKSSESSSAMLKELRTRARERIKANLDQLSSSWYSAAVLSKSFLRSLLQLKVCELRTLPHQILFARWWLNSSPSL